MDSTSSEISGKIRCAIKAKLEELGAYVDEELPDYIMVMIANKKTKQQMADDLGLFLGKNSAIFTDWLHDILSRLKALGRSNSTKKSETQNEDSKSKSNSLSKSERKRKSTSTTTTKIEEKKNTQHKINDKAKKDNNNKQQQEEINTVQNDNNLKEDNHKKELETKHKEKDKFEKKERKKIEAPKVDEREKIPQKSSDNRKSPKSRDCSTDLPILCESKRTSTTDVNRTSPTDVLRGSKRRSRESRDSPPLHKSRKGRHSSPEMRSDSRMKSLSSSLHKPESSIFLKAIHQATRSVTIQADEIVSNTTRKIAVESVEQPKEDIVKSPKHKHKKRKKDKKEKRRKRIVEDSGTGNEIVDQEKIEDTQKVAVEEVLETCVTNRKVEVAIEEESMDSTPQPDHELFVDVLAPNNTKRVAETRFVVTMEGLDDTLMKKWDMKVLNVQPSIVSTTEIDKKDDKAEEEDKRASKKPKLIKRWKTPATPVPSESPQPTQQTNISPTPSTTIIDKTDDPEDPAQVGSFVATIQPIAITLEEDDLEEDDEVILSSEGNYVSDAVVLAEDSLGPAQVINPTIINNVVQSPSASNVLSMAQHCRAFPNCKFADQCVYAHPHCRYDPFCAKPACPYKHSTTATGHTGGSFPALPVNCRYALKCTNTNCPFKHPQGPNLPTVSDRVCKFGNACTRQGCIFSHTGVKPAQSTFVDTSKMKWQKKTTSTPNLSQNSSI